MQRLWKKLAAIAVSAAMFLGTTLPVMAADMTNIPLSNGDFDTYGDSTNWSLTGFNEVKYDEYASTNNTYALSLWISNDYSTYASAAYTVTLTAGEYAFSFDFSGDTSNSGLSYNITNDAGTSLARGNTLSGRGWDNWQNYTTSTFYLSTTTTVNFSLEGTVPVGWWGYLDNLTLSGTGSITSNGTSGSTSSGTIIDDGEISVETINTLPDDFALGMDISSIVSEFNSGVTYQDYNGNTLYNVKEFCQFLANDCGISHVRVRVWNDPYDANGNGYGGGNCDINTAVQIAEGCAAAGLKMLIDFHYSDFWADPGKQTAPKAWGSYSLSQKQAAIAEFTTNSLEKIRATGATVDMVQIGNETTAGVCGEWTTENMCKIFNSASAAIRALDKSIRIVVHVTNPEKGNVTTWAKNLDTYNVDYDILATSYYPYWHGTLSNLTQQLQTVRTTYGKDVMVAETSYAYTLEDSDGWQNTINEGSSDIDMPYEFTPQGQANSVRSVINAVNDAGGIGVFYWEPAWITVGDIRGLSGDAYTQQWNKNSLLWETYGSGWASSYSVDYDPDDAGLWYGGSAVDNEAMFYPDGSPISSLRVWQYVRGNITTTEETTTTEPTTTSTESTTTTTEPTTPSTEPTTTSTEPTTIPTEPINTSTESVPTETQPTRPTQPNDNPDNTTSTMPTQTAEEPISSLCGDVNNDGEFNMADIVFLARILINTPSPDAATYPNADCNTDNIIDTRDLEIIVELQLHIIDTLPV